MEARNNKNRTVIGISSRLHYLYARRHPIYPHTTVNSPSTKRVALHLQLLFDGLCVVTHVFALVSQVMTNPGIISGLRSEYCIACCDPSELTAHTHRNQYSALLHTLGFPIQKARMMMIKMMRTYHLASPPQHRSPYHSSRPSAGTYTQTRQAA